MFGQLTERLGSLYKRLRGQGTLSEKDLLEASAEVRTALLEADVHPSVVDRVLAQVQTQVVGQALVKSLTAADQYLKVLYETVTEILGGGTAKAFSWGSHVPTVMMLVGLQGTGKTTTAAKLAYFAKQQGRRPLLVPADLQRPAAVAQLLALAKEWELPAYTPVMASSVVGLVESAINQARQDLHDTVIIDTAGRLHLDDALMHELKTLHARVNPSHTILVIDAMAGQQGLIAAQGFHTATPLTGAILSKADGDARGGVVLSCAELLKTPILFTGTGEKVSALEAFYPDRMASRIVGMGDLQTLAERVAQVTDQQTMAARVKKLAKGGFTLEDFRAQIKDMLNMEKWGDTLKMIPGAGKMLANVDFEKVRGDVKRKEAIINSMTVEERGDIRVLNGNRRRRIAAGSGTTVTDVNRLIKEFELLQKMMKKGNSSRGVSPQLLQMMRPGIGL